MESDVSCGEIRGCFMLAQGWFRGVPSFMFDTDRQAWRYKDTDRQRAQQTCTGPVHYFLRLIYYYIYFNLSYLVYFYCCDIAY